jgi:hypothetical protein
MLILAATRARRRRRSRRGARGARAARRGAPARADVLKQIGDVARSIGDFESAVESYRHALTLDPDFARRAVSTRDDPRDEGAERRGGAGAVGGARLGADRTPRPRSRSRRLRRRLQRHESRSRCSSTCCSAIHTTSMPSRRSARRCSRVDVRPDAAVRVRARVCASIPSTSARCTSRACSPLTSIAIGKRSTAGGASSTSSRRASTRARAARHANGRRSATHLCRTGARRVNAIEGPLRELGIHDVFQLLDSEPEDRVAACDVALSRQRSIVCFESGSVSRRRSARIRIRSARCWCGGKISEGDLERARRVQAQPPRPQALGELL